MTHACLPRDQLKRLLMEQLGKDERGAVERHVQECAACQHELDRLLDAEREYCVLRPGTAAAESTPAGAEVLERLKLSPPIDSDAAERVSRVVFQFPGPPTPQGPLGQLRSYHVIELLGAGATGYVFKCYDQDLDRVVAIKLLRPELAVLAGSRTRFLREARTAAAIRHQHVVGIHSVESIPEFPLPYIVMEYVAGETLTARLQREPHLPVHEAVAIVRQVAIGLSAAHDRGLVHRDIKPSNILLQRGREQPGGMESTDEEADHFAHDPVPCVTCGPASAQSLVAKITDFGLARAVEAADQENMQRLTQSGYMLGTPAYMSPEHILAPENVDAQSDVYSLGVVLYELLTGQLPFSGTAHQVLMQAVHDDPVGPHLRKVHVPLALNDITLACLAKEPARRYRSARELAVELERWQAGEKVRVRPRGVVGKLARWCRRNSALASAWTMTGLLCVGLVLMAILLSRLRRESEVRLQGGQEQISGIRNESQRLAAHLALDRGVVMCGQGQTHQGLLWLTRALELAPKDAADLQWSIRAQLATWSQAAITLRRVFPHQGMVRTVGFSPDGRMLLTHSIGTDSWQWDIATGRRINTPATDVHRNSAAAFSPDGQTVLLGFGHGIISILDVPTGKRHYIHAVHNGEITALAFSADSSCYLTGGRDKTAQRWKTRTPEAEPLGPRLEHPSTVEAVAFSPDGRMLLTGCADNHARLWDADTGKLLGSPLVHEGPVTAVAFSPDGRMVLTASKDHTARLWDTASGRPIGSPLLHKDKVFVGVFSPDSRLVGTGSNDCTARVWDVRTCIAIGAPLMHDSPVSAVAFSPDGRQLATGGEDSVARLWQLPHTQSLEQRVDGYGRTGALAFSPDGLTIAIAVELANTSAAVLQRYDVRSWELASPSLQHTGFVHAVTFRPDGKLLLTGSLDQTARLWNVATGQPVDPPIQLDHPVLSAAFSPDGRIVLTGDEDKRIRFWDGTTLAALRQPLIHQGGVYALTFSRDGRLILSGSWDKTAQLWEVDSGTPRGSPVRHRGPVMAVAFSPDGKSFVTGSRDSTAQVWDTETGQPSGQPLVHQQPILAVAFSPDGRMVATGSEDHTAQFWDLATRHPLGPPLAHRNAVSAVAFRPDGRVLVTAGEESLVHVWTVPTPVEGQLERIQLWVQVTTGSELEADGRVHRLSAQTWHQRHQRLEELGRPPLP
jgi:WD40 repeat protein/serine/threonine protein kinase